MAPREIRFDGRAILVTGAARGMGRAHAMLLASRGARVVVADNGGAMDGSKPSPDPSEAVVAEIRAAGGEAVAFTADLAREGGSTGAVETTLSAFGRIDGLLHNASTVPELTTTDKLSSHDLELVMRVNAFAGLWMARAAWPHMAGQRYGRILYVTSAGIFGAPRTALYCAAKAAGIGIMRCLAPEGIDQGILVNALAPCAYTRMTERHPSAAHREWLSKTMPADKVSVGAAYLMSEACSVSGEVFAMEGGHIGRIAIAESEGILGAGTSIEEVHDLIPRVMADTRFFHPKDAAERSTRVAALFGVQLS